MSLRRLNVQGCGCCHGGTRLGEGADADGSRSVSREQCLEVDVCCEWKSDEQRREGLCVVGGRVQSVAERRMRRSTVSKK